MDRTWKTQRLALTLLGPGNAAEVRDYGLRSYSFHVVWDPERPADFWDLPQVAERLRQQAAEAERGQSLCLSLTDRKRPDHIIGSVNLRNIIRGALQGCHLGYALAPDAIGKGYMTEAITEVVRIAFTELGLHRVEANVMPRNARSLAVMERVGFSEEGLSPRYLRIAGMWEDHIRFGILNDGLS